MSRLRTERGPFSRDREMCVRFVLFLGGDTLQGGFALLGESFGLSAVYTLEPD